MPLDFQGFDTEDNAEFGTQQQDWPMYWYSMLPTKKGSTVSGFFIPVTLENVGDIPEELDAALKVIKAPIVTIVHDTSNEREAGRKSGNNVKDYYHLTSVSLFPIISGMREPLPECGMVSYWSYPEQGTRWNVARLPKPTPSGSRSHLKFRVYITELINAGWVDPLGITTKSFYAGALIDALRQQQTVMSAYRTLIGKKDAPLPFWAFSIPIGCSDLVSKGKDTKKGMILPIALIPEKVGEAYLKDHFVDSSQLGGSLRDLMKSMVPETIDWSLRTTAAILDSKQEQRAVAKPDLGVSEPEGYQFEPETYGRYDAEPEPEPSPSPSPVAPASSTPATPANEGQRKALKTLAAKYNLPLLMQMASDPRLTSAEAAKSIANANKVGAGAK